MLIRILGFLSTFVMMLFGWYVRDSLIEFDGPRYAVFIASVIALLLAAFVIEFICDIGCYFADKVKLIINWLKNAQGV